MRAGLDAARRNRRAGVALWIFGCLIVAAYYYLPAAQRCLEQIAGWKTQFGYLFSGISTGLFGGLLPSLIQRLPAADRPPAEPASRAVSNTLFWALKGLEIDWLYRTQAWLFGDRAEWGTVAIKTAVDQLIYVPLFGLVNVILFYRWRQAGYRFATFRRDLGQHWYRDWVLPVLIANWLIWIPAVLVIYSLPTALQLPVQNLILCFWILLLTFLTTASASVKDAQSLIAQNPD